MKVSFTVILPNSQDSPSQLILLKNGDMQGRVAYNTVTDIEVMVGDEIAFKLLNLHVKTKIRRETKNLIVFWNVPKNPLLRQLKMAFTNCLSIIEVDDEAFKNPSKYVYGKNMQHPVASDKGLSAIGLVLAMGMIYLSVSSTDQLEWWRDVAMVLGLGGAFRFLTFLFSKEVYPRSGFGAFLLFALVSIFLAISSTLVFPLKLSLLIIPLTLPLKAYLAYFKNKTGLAL